MDLPLPASLGADEQGEAFALEVTDTCIPSEHLASSPAPLLTPASCYAQLGAAMSSSGWVPAAHVRDPPELLAPHFSLAQPQPRQALAE